MFNKADLVNLHNLLQRATFKGLEEAEIAIVLSHKIKAALNVSDLSRDDQPSPASGVGG